MKDQEIINALRTCSYSTCDACEYRFYAGCKGMLLNKAIDRLEELTASQHVMKMREDA